MNPKLQGIQEVLRKLCLLRTVDHCRYILRRLWLYPANKRFRRRYPDFALPPPHLAFDAHGTVHWESYRRTGLELAQRIAAEGKELARDIESCLEWGCGPGRVIRHIPRLLNGSEIFGSDYNRESIAFCKEHLPGIHFVTNELKPPLPFEDQAFSFIYAVSVFTHLSQDSCLQWIDELLRVLKPRGILMIWTNGDLIAPCLLPHEKRRYNASHFVVRDKYEEGKKMFLSFHPREWVQSDLLRKFRVLRHYSGGFSGTEQDVWIAQPRGEKGINT